MPRERLRKFEAEESEVLSMKLKAVVSSKVSREIVDAVGSPEFAYAFMTGIVSGIFGVEDSDRRPAEYYVQMPDRTISLGPAGVELRLTGVSRGTRSADIFHKALNALHTLAKERLQIAANSLPAGFQVQLFCVLMLDGDIETAPGSGKYSSVLEHDPEWIEAHPSKSRV